MCEPGLLGSVEAEGGSNSSAACNRGGPNLCSLKQFLESKRNVSMRSTGTLMQEMHLFCLWDMDSLCQPVCKTKQTLLVLV